MGLAGAQSSEAARSALALAALKGSESLHDVAPHKLALQGEKQNRLHRPRRAVHGLRRGAARAHGVEVISNICTTNRAHFARPEVR
jgi:hypothetical protein